MKQRQLDLKIEAWPIAGSFTISRGTKTEARVVVVEITEDGAMGKGECVPYPRNNESPEGVLSQIETLRPQIEAGLSVLDLQAAMPPGAARNAIDCALIDLACKQTHKSASDLLKLPPIEPVTTAFTISLGTPKEMAAATADASDRPLLKIKLGGEGDEARIRAVRSAAPEANLIVDANEAWTIESLPRLTTACAEARVSLIEQPLPAASDEVLSEFVSPVPLCADESFHDRSSIDTVAGRYQYVNIKLDKTGGLTEALGVAHAAMAAELKLMIGCMVGTSLSMAPALSLSPFAEFVDLDGPLLLARDRPSGLVFDGSTIHPPRSDLWG